MTALRNPGVPPNFRFDRFFTKLAQKPERALAAFILVQVVCWSVLPALVSSAPRLDVVEGLIWGREWVIGTFKHPPLPAWLAEISLQLSGSPIFGPILAGQLCVGLTYIFVFLLGRRLTTSRNALVGTLLLAGVYYFTWPTTELNHNLVQLPIWSGMFLLFVITRENPERPAPWIWLGIVAGIGIYSKFSIFILYFILGAWILYERDIRRSLLTPWPWVGAFLAIVIAFPEIFWIFANNFLPFKYAEERGGAGSIAISLKWILAQLLDHAPLLIFGAIVGYSSIRKLACFEERNHDTYFIAYLAIAPAVVTVIAATVTDTGLRDMWGMPMFTLSGLLVVLLLNRVWTDLLAGRALAVASGFVVVIASAYAIVVAVSPLTNHLQRAAWPMKEIAESAREAWDSHTNMPLKFVSGNPWLAGLIAIGAGGRPSVVYDGRLEVSPWLDRSQLDKDGVIYVWLGSRPPANLLPAGADLIYGAFPVAAAKIPGGVVGYAIQLPKGQ